jgi:hypothetical protein
METSAMEYTGESTLEDRSPRLIALLYYAVMLAGLAIGLYGLLSLFSLTTSQVLRTGLTG